MQVASVPCTFKVLRMPRVSCEAIPALIAAGVDPNEVNEDCVVPLILAAHYSHLECVRALCDNGANVNLAAEARLWEKPVFKRFQVFVVQSCSI